MAAIYKRLSTKVQADRKVLISLRNGKDYFVRSKSGIFCHPYNFLRLYCGE